MFPKRRRCAQILICCFITFLVWTWICFVLPCIMSLEQSSSYSLSRTYTVIQETEPCLKEWGHGLRTVTNQEGKKNNKRERTEWELSIFGSHWSFIYWIQVQLNLLSLSCCLYKANCGLKHDLRLQAPSAPYLKRVWANSYWQHQLQLVGFWEASAVRLLPGCSAPPGLKCSWACQGAELWDERLHHSQKAAKWVV